MNGGGLTGDLGQHRNWCRGLFNSLREGGVWGVPRSGLVFKRRGNELVLVSRLPFSEIAGAAEEGRDVPATEEELRKHQDEELELTRAHFGEAGIPVTDGDQGGGAWHMGSAPGAPTAMSATTPAPTTSAKRVFLCGTRAVLRLATSDYRVVCATCNGGGGVRHYDQDTADRAAVRDSARACRVCGAQ